MDFAFILDPLPSLKAYKDTSVAMMRALAARGHRVHALQAPTGVPRAPVRAPPRSRSPVGHDWYREDAVEDRALKDFTAVLMRKGPAVRCEDTSTRRTCSKRPSARARAY